MSENTITLIGAVLALVVGAGIGSLAAWLDTRHGSAFWGIPPKDRDAS